MSHPEHTRGGSPVVDQAPRTSLAHVEQYVLERSRAEVSVERKAELSKELATVVQFFADAGIRPYVAGGSGLDLLDGQWNRDHQDLDMAILGTQRQALFDAATREGFLVTDHTRRSLTIEEITDSTTHNAFLFRNDERGVTQFEVMFVEDATSFDHAPTRTVDGVTLDLQPPEVILSHKLRDGRRKDFRDAQVVLDQLDAEQKARLADAMTSQHFTINGETVTDVTTLLERAASIDNARQRAFFESRLPAIEREIAGEYMTHCRAIYAIHERTPDRAQFFDALAEKYAGFLPERRAHLEDLADVLFSSPTPSLEAFQSEARRRVNLDEKLQHQALHEFLSEKLWTTLSTE